MVDVGLVSYGFTLDYTADGGAGGALVLGGEQGFNTVFDGVF